MAPSCQSVLRNVAFSASCCVQSILPCPDSSEMPWKPALSALLPIDSPYLHVICSVSFDCSCRFSSSAILEWPLAALAAVPGCKMAAWIYLLNLTVHGCNAISSDFYEVIVKGHDTKTLSSLIAYKRLWIGADILKLVFTASAELPQKDFS